MSLSAVDGGNAPVGAEEFAGLMAGFGPFEPAPHLAVAVSGGADSLALALLAADWARALGGAASALVVDHRLRAESGAEARRTAAGLRARGIRAAVLTRRGPAPASAVEACARAARYRLLGEWCLARRVLHLLVGHNLEDQAETLLLRLAAGSGPDGLAGMPAVRETGWGRLLRPLLAVPGGRLRATLHARGAGWLEDPHNADPAFARARLRRASGVLAREGLGAARLAATAGRMGEARAVLEAATAALLARAASIHPAGFVRLDRSELRAAPADTARRAVERALGAVGGGAWPPRGRSLARLLAELRGGGALRGRTLGGCVVRPDGGRVLIAREPSAAGPPARALPGGETRWDGRFRLRISGAAPARAELRVAALGREGWRAMKAAGAPPAASGRVPAAARAALPALWDRDGLVEAPHLGWRRAPEALVERVAFAPRRPLAAAEFSVV